MILKAHSVTGIMVTLHSLLLLGKTLCFGYIHCSQQQKLKLMELPRKENTVQIQESIKPWYLCGKTYWKKILHWKERLQPNSQNLENAGLQQPE